MNRAKDRNRAFRLVAGVLALAAASVSGDVANAQLSECANRAARHQVTHTKSVDAAKKAEGYVTWTQEDNPVVNSINTRVGVSLMNLKTGQNSGTDINPNFRVSGGLAIDSAGNRRLYYECFGSWCTKKQVILNPGFSWSFNTEYRVRISMVGPGATWRIEIFEGLARKMVATVSTGTHDTANAVEGGGYSSTSHTPQNGIDPNTIGHAKLRDIGYYATTGSSKTLMSGSVSVFRSTGYWILSCSAVDDPQVGTHPCQTYGSGWGLNQQCY